MSEDEYITVEEAATRLGISPATVKRRCSSGELPARKVGRGWVLEATRLPPPRVRRPTRRPSTAAALVDLADSLRELETQDLRRDLWVPDILRHEDDVQGGRVLEIAAAKLDGREPYDPAVAVPVPKSPFFLRNAANLTLADRIAYHAAVRYLAPGIDARTSSNIYSARLSSRRRRFLVEGAEAWTGWKRAVARAITTGQPWMIETDITSFFDSISHTILMQDLQDVLKAPPPIVSAIRDMLRTWATTPNTGIPQGPDASRVLANFYMHEIDSVMLAIPGISYFRYMDDIRIVSEKKHEAINALKTLDRECRQRNLYLSTKKTALHFDAAALKSLTDEKIDEAAYAFKFGEAAEDLRKQLTALFRSALKPDGIEARRARFALYRLRALRESSVLGQVLKRLDDLAPLGWMVAAYLLPWLRRPSVAKGIMAYLADPERNTSDYLSTWLLAAFLDEPLAITSGVLEYARSIAFDRACTSYHRAIAMSVVGLVVTPRDLARLREIVRREFDPEAVRGAVVALHRAGQLDKGTSTYAKRITGLDSTIAYLGGRRDVPSLIFAGVRVPVR